MSAAPAPGPPPGFTVGTFDPNRVYRDGTGDKKTADRFREYMRDDQFVYGHVLPAKKYVRIPLGEFSVDGPTRPLSEYTAG